MSDKVFCCGGNKLICTVGLPRSGKSTWARQSGYPVVDPDGIRIALTGRRWYAPVEHEVWATALTMVRALFFGGNKVVVLDSTGITRKARDTFRPSEDCTWTREFMQFDTPAEECKRRAELTYPELIPVIDRMAGQWEPVDVDEEGPVIHCKRVHTPPKGV